MKKLDRKELRNKRKSKLANYVDTKPKADVTVMNNGIMSPVTGMNESKANQVFEKYYPKKKKGCGKMSAMESVSLHKKAEKSGIDYNILEQVFYRGLESWEASMTKTPQQYAFDRVNSFVAGGKSFTEDDADLSESVMLSESYAPTAQDLGITFEAGFEHHPTVQEAMEKGKKKDKEDEEEDEGELSFEDVANLVKILKKVGRSK